MEQHELEQKVAENKKLLDGLDLPKPTIGENVRDYCCRVEKMFKDVELPDEYEGDLFYWLYNLDVGDYLSERFNMHCQEVSSYFMV